LFTVKIINSPDDSTVELRVDIVLTEDYPFSAPKISLISEELSDDSKLKFMWFDKLHGIKNHDAAHALLITIAACVKAGDIRLQDAQTLKCLLLNCGDLDEVRGKMAELKEGVGRTEDHTMDPPIFSRYGVLWTTVTKTAEQEFVATTGPTLGEVVTFDSRTGCDLMCLHELKNWSPAVGIKNLLLSIQKMMRNSLGYQLGEELHKSIHSGIERVKFCLEAGADINFADFRSRTALQWSADFGLLDIVKFLVEANADINQSDIVKLCMKLFLFFLCYVLRQGVF